jgi:hypothetical protein
MKRLRNWIASHVGHIIVAIDALIIIVVPVSPLVFPSIPSLTIALTWSLFGIWALLNIIFIKQSGIL